MLRLSLLRCRRILRSVGYTGCWELTQHDVGNYGYDESASPCGHARKRVKAILTENRGPIRLACQALTVVDSLHDLFRELHRPPSPCVRPSLTRTDFQTRPGKRVLTKDRHYSVWRNTHQSSVHLPRVTASEVRRDLCPFGESSLGGMHLEYLCLAKIEGQTKRVASRQQQSRVRRIAA